MVPTMSRMPNHEISKSKAPCATETDSARSLSKVQNDAMCLRLRGEGAHIYSLDRAKPARVWLPASTARRYDVNRLHIGFFRRQAWDIGAAAIITAICARR